MREMATHRVAHVLELPREVVLYLPFARDVDHRLDPSFLWHTAFVRSEPFTTQDGQKDAPPATTN